MRAAASALVRRLVVAAVLAGALFPAGPVAAAAADAPATTVLLVRHVEKNPHPAGGDAGITTAGLLRAHELARVVKDAGVAAVYATQYDRTRRSAEPAAEVIGDSVRSYDANRNDLLAERIRREHAGRTVLVVGHGDTLPELYNALTGARLPGDEGIGYDRLFVLTLPAGGGHSLVKLRYGKVPADAVPPAPRSVTSPAPKGK
jgi:probable phosphoglycerate mutase